VRQVSTGRLLLVWRDAFAEAVPSARFLFVEFPAFGHEIGRKSSEGFGEAGQFSFDDRAKHQCVADFFNLDFLAWTANELPLLKARVSMWAPLCGCASAVAGACCFGML